MTKVSNGIQILLSIREFMLEKKFTYMGNLSRTQTLLNMQQFSLVRRPISVMNVEKLSDTAQSLLGIRESTLERDPKECNECGKGFGGAQILLDTRGFTLERDSFECKECGEHSA